MYFISFFLLLFPGLISVSILWRNKKISQGDYFFVLCDYAIYSFLILLSNYGFMLFTYPERTVSFSANVPAFSSIDQVSFVFSYALVSLISALALPPLVSWITKIWRNFEDGRVKKKR